MIDDKRLRALEESVASIKGFPDLAMIAFTMLATITLAGFTILYDIDSSTSAKIDGLSAKITDEFRLQRAEQSAQISTLANVTATKQQAPQVLLVPAPSTQPPKLYPPEVNKQPNPLDPKDPQKQL